jgi:hypothetical protein
MTSTVALLGLLALAFLLAQRAMTACQWSAKEPRELQLPTPKAVPEATPAQE